MIMRKGSPPEAMEQLAFVLTTELLGTPSVSLLATDRLLQSEVLLRVTSKPQFVLIAVFANSGHVTKEVVDGCYRVTLKQLERNRHYEFAHPITDNID